MFKLRIRFLASGNLLFTLRVKNKACKIIRVIKRSYYDQWGHNLHDAMMLSLSDIQYNPFMPLHLKLSAENEFKALHSATKYYYRNNNKGSN